MSLSQLPFTELLNAFRSREPTPGGGSASALGGAVGAALLAMVAGLPKSRAQSTEDTERLGAVGTRCAAIGDSLASLMDRDSHAYDLVVAAFRLPKSTAEEQTARASRIQEALRSATEAPLDVMRACAEAIGLAAVVAALGSRNASSDVQVGVELLRAGLRGAKLNVDVNLASIKDETFASAVRHEAEHLVIEGERNASAAVSRLESESSESGRRP
jgi:formiminotetrahydrofolate cyclodeaminase